MLLATAHTSRDHEELDIHYQQQQGLCIRLPGEPSRFVKEYRAQCKDGNQFEIVDSHQLVDTLCVAPKGGPLYLPVHGLPIAGNWRNPSSRADRTTVSRSEATAMTLLPSRIFDKFY